MADLQVDPGTLRMRLQELLRLRESGGIDPEQTEALAECCFRLAVVADTPFDESLDLLRRAVRYDGANPKYAYHLARLYFKHGKMEHAASWLILASRLCPTSHRIWCHISLLQKELDRVYSGKPEFEPQALRNRGHKIARAIREGKDEIDPILLDFKPPPSKKAGGDDEQRKESEDPAVAGTEPAAGKARERQLKVRRLMQPGICRWSGVRDLLAEEMLSQAPSKRNLRQIASVLESLADSAVLNHPGARSRFAILAIEWMLGGYPIERLRRMRARIDAGAGSPSLDLLDLVCDLYEAPSTDLPGMIAESLRDGRIPHLLAALIHQRRLLWRSMEFRKIGDYRAARKLLAEVAWGQPGDEDALNVQVRKARDYSRSLNLGVRQLTAEQPPTFEDRVSEDKDAPVSDGASADKRLTELEEAARKLVGLADAAFNLLKQDLEPRVSQIADDAAWSQAVADRTAFDEIIEALTKAGGAGKQGVERLVNTIADLGEEARPKGFSERQERCGKQFGDLMLPGRFKKSLKRVDTALGAVSERFKAVPGPRSEEIKRVLMEIRETTGIEISGDPERDEPAQEPDPPYPTEAVEVVESAEPADPPADAGTSTAETGNATDSGQPAHLRELCRAVDDVDRCVAEIFEKANATFEAYSAYQKLLPSIQAIRMLVQAKQADTLYRLGHRAEARRVWTGILREDRTNCQVLKNIAVSDTGSADVSRSLASWRSYIEILYFYDIVGGSPRAHGSIRALFHRAFGNAYAPAFLFAELDNKWADNVDNLALFSFLASPGRMRNFVNHKMLEFVNTRLSFVSPPLILGVARTDGEQVRTAAKESLGNFLQSVCRTLPERVRDAFVGLAERHIGQAFEACASAKRLTARKDPHYSEEEDAQLQLLKEFVDLKYKLVIAIQKNKDLVKHMESVHFLDELARLDEIPIGQSDGMLRPVAGARGLTPEGACGLMSNELRGRLITNLLELVFSEGDGSDQSIRTRQYRHLVDEWVSRPSFAEYLDFIDDPQHFYPEEVRVAFTDDRSSQQAVEILYGWHQRFPEFTGPVRLLAQLLHAQGKFDEAIRVLTEACDRGFYRKRVVSCYSHRMVCWYHRSAQLTDKTEAKRSAEHALQDALVVIAESDDREEVARAQEIQNNIRQALRA